MKLSLKFRAPLFMTEKERRDINDKMRVYSQDRELEKEFGIKPDSTLYHFEAKFQNGFRADLNVCSGQVNCWVECVLYNEEGVEVDSILLEDYLYYSDGTDAMSNMDDVTVKYGGADYRIVITPKTKKDVVEFENYLKETLSEFDYKQYVNYTEKPIVVTGNIEEIEKAKKVLAEAGIDVTINENLLQEWCARELKINFDTDGYYKSREELLEIANKYIDDDGIWTIFNENMNDWVEDYLSKDKSSPFENKIINLRKQILNYDTNSAIWDCLRPISVGDSITYLKPSIERVLSDHEKPMQIRIFVRMDICLNCIYAIDESQRDAVICEIEEVLANKETWTGKTKEYFDEIIRGMFRKKIELNKN